MKLSVITLPITILGFAHASNPECIEYAEEIKSKRSEEKTDSKVAIIPLSGELWEKITQIMEERLDELKRESNSNLLEIKLKDTDSVPEVYYKGERMAETQKGLTLIAKQAKYFYDQLVLQGFNEEQAMEFMMRTFTVNR